MGTFVPPELVFTEFNDKRIKMSKYIKRPLVIEAIQWKGDLYKLVNEFVKLPPQISFYPLPSITIETPEGNMRCEVGDYIVKGIRGEFYPCKKDIFEESYTKIEDEE